MAAMLVAGQPAPGRAQVPPVAPPPLPTFKAGVDLVSVSAVVRDCHGRPVTNLTKADFEVLDQGRRRPIIDFSSNVNGAASVALLFDVSGSMRVANKIDSARAAAEHVLQWMASGRDEAAVFTFDTQLRELQGFTGETARLTKAIRTFEPYGATSLYDAIAETARAISGRAIRRRGILVLTDGIDTYSTLTPEQVTGIASSIDVPVYLFAVVSPTDHPGGEDSVLGDAPSPLTGPLAKLAHLTGGDIFIMSAPAHASVAARQFMEELHHQYLIAFETTGTGGWHRLEIRARNREHLVRARGGYFADHVSPASPGEAFEGSH